jgi:hypothetical protein
VGEVVGATWGLQGEAFPSCLPERLKRKREMEAMTSDIKYDHDDYPDYDDEYTGRLADGTHFADTGGTSALRASGPGNPRNLPCPTCEQPNALTPADVERGYQCDRCADQAESGY